VLLSDATIEVIDPGLTARKLTASKNPAGAWSYSVPLLTVELDRDYIFRVTLGNGNQIVNTIKTPAQALVITNPAFSATLDKDQSLLASWNGNNAGNAGITIRQSAALDVILTTAAPVVLSLDNGGHFLAQVRNAMEPLDIGTGTRLFTVTRRNTKAVNGFAAGSKLFANLVHAREVNITETP